MRIERVRRDFLPGVWEVEEASFADPYPRWYLEALSRSSSFFYVALAGEKVVGYATASVEGDLVHIISLAVLPQFRRRGIGRALLRRILGGAKALGLRGAILEAKRGNEAAEALYRSLGFAERGFRAGYYENGADASVFELDFKGGGSGKGRENLISI